MDKNYVKIPAVMNSNVSLKVIRGHFATSHSHINCFFDITTMKTRCSEAHNVASLLAMHYSVDTQVDTIICMDGTEVIGTYLAEELTKSGILSINAHKTIYVVSPEYIASGQIIFRDNIQMAIRDKHILVLMGSVTTGKTLETALECIRYYRGNVTGACAVFSAVERVDDIDIHAIFHPDDVHGFASYPANECPLCRSGERIHAIVNSFGYSTLN